MKKIFNSFIAICSLVFLSCGDYQIPQSVSIKTDADYNFSVGSIEQDLSSFLNIKTISEKLNSSLAGGTENAFSSFSVYDYRPTTDNTNPSQKFLAEVKLQEIPVDISEYLSNMDISTALTEQSFEQEFTIPSLSVDSLSSDIDLPDFNKIISSSAEIGLPPDLKIIIPGNLNAEIEPFSININVTSPEFSSISFYEGNLQVSIITDEEVYGSTVDAKLELLDSDGNLVSQASNTITNQATFLLPIAGKTLKPNMKLKLSGKQSGGKDLNFPE